MKSYIPSFIKIPSGIRKLKGKGNVRTHIQDADHTSIHPLFPGKKSSLIINLNLKWLINSSFLL
jgi:hypothetical protein